jgi:hypothetical protein
VIPEPGLYKIRERVSGSVVPDVIGKLKLKLEDKDGAIKLT